jgi:integrase/recombinase XerD
MPATLAEDVEAYAEHQRAGGARSRTVQARLCGVRLLSTFCTDGDPRTVTRGDLTRWLGNPQLAAWTRATYWCHARAWCAFLVESGRREDDPAAKMKRPRVPRGVPRPLSNAQVATVLAVAGRKTRVFVLLAAYAGLRVHEIAQIRGEDVDDRTVRVVNGKGGHDRVIPTHPFIWAAAADFPRRGLWFPSYGVAGHIKADSVSTAIRRALLSVGIEGHAHQLRHTFGTQVLKSSGGNLRVAQELLGHASPASTALYTLVDQDDLRAAVLGLPGLAAAPLRLVDERWRTSGQQQG